jgi:hypothetical protein
MVAEGSCDAYFEYGIHIISFCFFFFSGVPLNLLHRCILCSATKKLAEQISPLLTHVNFPDD